MWEQFFENLIIVLRYLTDFLIIATAIYWLLYFMRGARSANVLIGVILLFCFAAFFAECFNLVVLGYLLERLWTILGVAIIVIFQPELRRAFAQAGSIFSRNPTSREMIDEVVLAVDKMSAGKTGALIVFEQNIGLAGIINNAVPLDAKVSSLLLQSIFFKNSPLHDCAVIIRKNKIVAAHAVLPMTQEDIFNPVRHLGTRHRAAVGITEETDAVALTVSEETGIISLANKGRIVHGFTPEELTAQLNQFLLPSKRDYRKLFASMQRSKNAHELFSSGKEK